VDARLVSGLEMVTFICCCHWVSLLFGRRKLTVGSVQLVRDLDGHGFAAGTHCPTQDANHLPVALVGFLDRILSNTLHGDAGSPGVPFIRRARAIQLYNIGLAGQVGHAQAIAFHFEGDREPVIGEGLHLRGHPGARHRM